MICWLSCIIGLVTYESNKDITLSHFELCVKLMLNNLQLNLIHLQQINLKDIKMG